MAVLAGRGSGRGHRLRRRAGGEGGRGPRGVHVQHLHHFHNPVTNQSATVALDGLIRVPTQLLHALDAVKGVHTFPTRVYSVATHRSRARLQQQAAPATPSSSHAFRPQSTSFPLSHPSHSMQPMQAQETNAQCPSTLPPSAMQQRLLAPATLASQYNFPLRANDSTPQQTRAMVAAGFAGQAYSPSDLTSFLSNIGFTPSATLVDVPPNLNANTLSGYGVGSEANIDIQALYQTAPTNAQNQVLAMDPSAGYDLDDALTAIINIDDSDRPHVVSFSYLFGYSDWTFLTGDNFRSEALLLQLALMGVTVVAAAGDDGATSFDNPMCSTSTGLSPFLTTPILPQYPASSPYVLSVGETAFTYGATAQSYLSLFSQNLTSPPECNNCPTDQPNAYYTCQTMLYAEEPVSTSAPSGAQVTTSGGGFSSILPSPSWQQAAVQGYLTSTCATGSSANSNGCFLPPSSYFNQTGRGFPDVTGFGGYFGLVVNGQEAVYEGSSVSAPMWAGFISRLNEVALALSGKPLGFINPLLYQMAAAAPSTFHDIVVGENFCPQGNAQCAAAVRLGNYSGTTCSGFFSTAGWDPVTGLGSPNVGAMLGYLTDVVFASGLSSTAGAAAPASVPGVRMSSTGSMGGLGVPTSSSASTGGSGMPTSSSSASTGTASAYSDPRFVGFWHQDFFVSGQTHGVYSLLSDAEVQVNAYFVYLDHIRCPIVNGREMTHCSDHAGTYFGVLAMVTKDGHQLRITAGAVDEGFHAVTLDGHDILLHLNTTDATNRTEVVIRTPPVSASSTAAPAVTVRLTSGRSLVATVGLYSLMVENSDLYVDLTEVAVTCWDCLLQDAKPEGLLGRTWDRMVGEPKNEEEVELYRERDDNILGCNIARDAFCSRNHITSPPPLPASAAWE